MASWPQPQEAPQPQRPAGLCITLSQLGFEPGDGGTACHGSYHTVRPRLWQRWGFTANCSWQKSGSGAGNAKTYTSASRCRSCLLTASLHSLQQPASLNLWSPAQPPECWDCRYIPLAWFDGKSFETWCSQRQHLYLQNRRHHSPVQCSCHEGTAFRMTRKWWLVFLGHNKNPK